MGRAFRLIKKLLKYAGTDSADTYRKKQGVFWSKMRKKRPVLSRFCSMYGDVPSYPLDEAGFAMGRFSPFGGALARKSAPSVSWAREPLQHFTRVARQPMRSLEKRERETRSRKTRSGSQATFLRSPQ